MLKHIIQSFILFSFISVTAQIEIKAQLLDSTNLSPVPYASVQLNKKTGVISNEFGEFTLKINRSLKASDSLNIGCLGYQNTAVSLKNFNASLIYLNPQYIDLEQVNINREELDVKQIIDSVKSRLENNYEKGFTKRKLFFRNSDYGKLVKNEIKLKESSIPEINQAFIDSIFMAVPKNYDSHAEILAELYGKLSPESTQKMDVLKACYLYDKSNEITFENYEKRFNAIFNKYIKRDSYFKIKSGLFGTKEAIDSTMFGDPVKTKEEQQTEAFIKAQKEKEEKRKASFLKYRKQQIRNTELDNFLNEDHQLNFLEKSNKYIFNHIDYEVLDDSFVYKITFEPKRGADFEGMLYVNTDDFGIVRLDYHNVKPLRKFALLGISYNEFEKKGTIIFNKNENDRYVLKYMDETSGTKTGIKRPLKIIEKNKNVRGRRKQNEVSCDLHFIINSTEKKELIVFESENLTNENFDSFTETPNVLPAYLDAYDPSFWEGYNIIEPNEALKNWKLIETDVN